MAKCKICTNTNAKYLLENARHLTGEKVCLSCYQNFNEDSNQTYLFQEDDRTPMSYDQFLEIYPKLGYTKIADFAKEIGISSNTPSTTWKKKGEVPYLVKFFLLTKLNNIELKEKTVYKKSTQNFSQELDLSDEELIQTVYAIKKGIFYMYHQKKCTIAKNRSIESIKFSRSRIKIMVKYLKRLFKFYNINNRPELELIHSTFIKISDYKRFEGYNANISHIPDRIKFLDTSYTDLNQWASRMWYAKFNFGNSISSIGWNDLIRYATKN